jgi:signal transduction histidine kinase
VADPVKRASQKRALGIFFVAFAITTAELCWWVTFNVRATNQQQQVATLRLERDCALAQSLLAEVEPGPARKQLQQRIAGSMPDIEVDALTGQARAKASVLAQVRQVHHAHVRMFLAEGTFFFFMVALGAGLIFRTMRLEVGVVRQQANFLNAITHELRSPLAAMRLYIETLQRRRVDPETLARYVATLRAECDRLETLVSHVLTVARIEGRAGASITQAAQQAPHKEACNLAAVTAAIIQEMQDELHQKGADLTYEAPAESIFAAIDGASLRTVMRNLIDNAVKYGGTAPRIDVRCGANGAQTWIQVRDFGLGLAAKELALVFDQFYRVGDEMVRRHEGSGLGLYLVRMLLAEHQGTITVASEGPGYGCTFVATLPRIVEE